MSGFRLHSNSALFILAFTFAAIAAGVPGCSEDLPLYEEPQNLVHVDLQINSGVIAHREQTGTAPLPVHISIVNTSDEVLQDSASMVGNVEIWRSDDPASRAFLPVRYARPAPPMSNGILTLEPNVAQLLLLAWDQKIGVRLYPWDGTHFVRRVDPYGVTYFQYDPILFIARATVQPFKTYNALATEQIQFTIIYQVFQGRPQMIH